MLKHGDVEHDRHDTEDTAEVFWFFSDSVKWYLYSRIPGSTNSSSIMNFERAVGEGNAETGRRKDAEKTGEDRVQKYVIA